MAPAGAIDETSQRLAELLVAEHGCHTVILYGSRARGDATTASDVDLFGVRQGPAARDARVVDGAYLDAFVYAEEALAKLESDLLRLLPGVVIVERDGFGARLLARLCELEAVGPAALPDDERRALVVWAAKMIDRFRGDVGIEANVRRMTLRVQALSDYFALRGAWFRGSKSSFAWLRAHDAAAYACFEAAMQPSATDDELAELVRVVYGTGGAPSGR